MLPPLGFTQEQVACISEVLEQLVKIYRLGRQGIFFQKILTWFLNTRFSRISTNAASTSAIIAPLCFTQEQVACVCEVLEQSGNIERLGR